MKTLSIPEIAKIEFKNHILKELSLTDKNSIFGMWQCYTPGTFYYSFDVSITPNGYITIGGDIGDVIIRSNYKTVYSIVAWIRGSVNSPDYLLSKVQPVCQEAMSEFSPQLAKEHLTDLMSSYECSREDIQRVRDLWKWGKNDGSVDDWYDAYSRVFPGDDLPDCNKLTPSAEWAIECLRLFSKLFAEK